MTETSLENGDIESNFPDMPVPAQVDGTIQAPLTSQGLPDVDVPQEPTATTRKRVCTVADTGEVLEDVPGPKRIRIEPASAEPAAPLPLAQATASYQRCEDFWYPDGNIVVVVQQVGFHLLLSCLKTYCKLFEREFPDEGRICRPEAPAEADVSAAVESREKVLYIGEGQTGDDSQVDESPSSGSQGAGDRPYTLVDVEAADFVTFLQALDTPLKYVLTPPTQAECLSLLRTAKTLECASVAEIAKHRLRSFWPPTLPGKHKKKSVTHTIDVINVAREVGVPEVLRAAYYELVRSPSFWERVATRRHALALSDADLVALYHARDVLQKKWAALLFTVPGSRGMCIGGNAFNSGPVARLKERCYRNEEAARKAAWQSELVQHTFLEKGSEDPIWYVERMLQSSAFRSLEGMWCATCMEQRREAWTAARTEWWDLLNDLFKFADV
ncbi:hypothetical protein PYCCODRAFT_1440687 [Trametes coccinea BRFM310]|uniref:BTB domain-containing protein n=1 Tax=Trametes coccinea (strain BRFM310) TaxID=1353009 RepID=A0A1Y2I6Y4_TRAC3|nr:hypothetical protein PYCCODRAFT_1440687 [Trametes coccinea BRFM310]